MLSSTATSASQLSYGNPRQIALTTSTNSLVMYTVPAGKKFQGSIYSSGVGQTVSITPAGGSSATIGNIPSSFPSPTTGLILVAGSSVTTTSTNVTTIIGVETDA